MVTKPGVDKSIGRRPIVRYDTMWAAKRLLYNASNVCRESTIILRASYNFFEGGWREIGRRHPEGGATGTVEDPLYTESRPV